MKNFEATTFVHYGDAQYRPELMPGAITCFGNGKPDGLWGSDIQLENSWKKWCEKEGFKIEKLSEKFFFKIKPGARILEIDTSDAIKPYLIPNPQYPPAMRSMLPMYMTYMLDAEKLKAYDGMYVRKGAINGYFELWDVESLVVWNDVIKEIEI